MKTDLVITERSYPYLVAQRGALDDMRCDVDLWAQKYLEVLTSEFESIAPYLPRTCESILDVGGGMGGIDVLLSEHYGGCHVTILDGIDDPPLMEKHAATFSNMHVASEFLALNGVASYDFIDANSAERRATRTYDLIVSFKSWCFHTPPELHLDIGPVCLREMTRLLVDIRRDKGDWELEMQHAFGMTRVVHSGVKFNTFCFHA